MLLSHHIAVCGTKNRRKVSILGPHIIGGKKAKIGEWPWMAFLALGTQKLKLNLVCRDAYV